MGAFSHVNKAMYFTFFKQVRSSLDTYYEIRLAPGPKDLYTPGHGTIIWFDHAAGHSVAIPETVCRQLEKSC